MPENPASDHPASGNPASGNALHRRVVGIDVGGTFTDIAVLDDGKLTVHKLPSTPADPSQGILQGVKETGVTSAEFVHGSTVATNALLEGKGARTALVTTTLPSGSAIAWGLSRLRISTRSGSRLLRLSAAAATRSNTCSARRASGSDASTRP